jgi:RNA polymerase-binding transcription factor DksA
MARIVALREALSREREGTYGRCERCAGPISPERLDILPTTTLCVSCARAATSEPAFRSADGARGAIQK